MKIKIPSKHARVVCVLAASAALMCRSVMDVEDLALVRYGMDPSRTPSHWTCLLFKFGTEILLLVHKNWSTQDKTACIQNIPPFHIRHQRN